MQTELILLNRIDIPEKYKRKNEGSFALDQKLLAASIRAVGMLFPVHVKKIGSQYSLIDGGRRVSASRMLAKTYNIMAYVIPETDNRDLDELRFHLNKQREDLKPMDEAKLIRELITADGMLKTQVAKALGKQLNTINRILDCLRIDERWQKLINNGQLNIHAGQHVAALSRKGQRQLYTLIKQKSLAFSEHTIRDVIRTMDPVKNPELFNNPKTTASMRISEVHGRPVAFEKVEGVAKQKLMTNHRTNLMKQYEDEINLAIPVIRQILSKKALCEELPTRSLNAFSEFAEEYL